MVFLVRETLTEEDKTAWKRVSIRRQKLARSGYGLFLSLWLAMKLLGAYVCGIGLLILYVTAVADPGLIMGVLQAAMALCAIGAGGWLISTFLRPPIRPEKLPERDSPPPGIPDTPVWAVFFGDNRFFFRDALEKVCMSYSSIISIWEDAGRFYLFFKDCPPLVLPKRGFAGGTPEDFRDFLEKEFGWPVERIK